jgi:ankyrin repeat protein
MFSTKILVLVVLACFVLCAECFTHLPQIRALKQTHLKSAIHDAAEKGDIEYCMEQLALDSTLISKFDIDGQLMLHHACKKGHLDLVKICKCKSY